MSSVNHEGGTIPIGVFIGIGVLEVAVIAYGLKVGADADRAAAASASIIPTPNCQIDTRTLPSSEASITVFDTKKCPPSSR